MTELVMFQPKRELDAEANLANFVSLARDQLTVFGSDLDFDSDEWDVTDSIVHRAKLTRLRIFFSTHETANTKPYASMSSVFRDFAKAYIRCEQSFRPTKDINGRMTALRCVDKSVRELNISSVVRIDGLALNRAVQIAQERNGPDRAYRIGQQLQRIAKFLDENMLVNVPLQWTSPLKRPSDTEKVGKEFEERRQSKLPSVSELDAVAKAYQLAVLDRDVIVTSIVAIMCATPDRISEVLTLPAQCEHTTRLANGQESYGLRYWPAKGADPMIKWVIPSMVDLMKEAVHRIRDKTESARRLARWYTEHQGQLYLPPELEHHRGRPLGMSVVSEILWGDPTDGKEAANWLKRRGYKVEKNADGEKVVDFGWFESEVIGMLPDSFPVMDKATGLLFRDALCVVHELTMHEGKRTLECSIEAISSQQIGWALGGREDTLKASVFQRLGIDGPDGEKIKINTHKFRHYLNTLAKMGGLDELDIAKWSGRKDVRQNAAYDHFSAKDKLALIRQSVGDSMDMFEVQGWTPNYPSISRDEFANLKITTAHTTEFGYCTHNFTSSPCSQHLDCLNCNELVCVKGDGVREQNIRRMRDETKALLEKAQEAQAQDFYGADRWVEHQMQTLERLDELCNIFNNPAVQNGAVIRLKHLPTVSRLVQAAEKIGIDLSRGKAEALGEVQPIAFQPDSGNPK